MTFESLHNLRLPNMRVITMPQAKIVSFTPEIPQIKVSVTISLHTPFMIQWIQWGFNKF